MAYDDMKRWKDAKNLRFSSPFSAFVIILRYQVICFSDGQAYSSTSVSLMDSAAVAGAPHSLFHGRCPGWRGTPAAMAGGNGGGGEERSGMW